MFDVEASEIFQGEMLKKKFSTDYLHKDSFLWLDPATMSLHWTKSADDRVFNIASPKYLHLNTQAKCAGLPKELYKGPVGESKGYLESVTYNGKSLVFVLDTKRSLDIKMGSDKASLWQRVVKKILEE